MKYAKKGFLISEQADLLESKIDGAIDIADISMKNKNLPQAKSYLSIARNGFSKLNNPELKGRVYLIYGKYYNHTEEYEKSNLYLDSAYRNFTDISKDIDCLELKRNNFELSNNIDSAYSMANRISILKEKRKEQNDKELEKEILAKFSVESSERELKISKQQNDLLELKSKKEQQLKYFGFGLFGLSIISLFLIIITLKLSALGYLVITVISIYKD